MAEAAPARPNIIIFLADDLGNADLGFRGSDIKTPHLDRLAREGMVLERFYSWPICTPTRAALMTGRDPMKLGMAYAGLQAWEAGGVAPQEHFMPQSFQAAGYQTAMIGKWHLGRAYESLVPHHRGFDHFFGHLNTQIDYFTHSVAGGYDLQENGKSVQGAGVYATDIHAREAVRFLTTLRDPEKPFLLYVPFLAPHSPMQAPPALEAKYPNRRNLPTPKKTYAAMVDAMDTAIGEILDALAKTGESERTLILFFSDNGGFAGFGGDNAPYRGGKLETFEGGIRVPAILHWPSEIAPTQNAQTIMSVMDIFPTLGEAAGIDIKPKKKLDGRSRWTALKKGEGKRAGALFFASNSPEYNLFKLAVIENDMKLVQIINHKNTATKIENYLFDLSQDPYEQHNLAAQKPSQVERLARLINQWRAQHPVSGLRVSIAPHPGWRAPTDYADEVRADKDMILQPFKGFGKMASKVLQLRYGDKGRIQYD